MAESYIAELGYKVDTRPLKRGESALDDVTKAGKRTEAGISSLTSTVGVLSAGIAALAANTVINDLISYSNTWTKIDNQLRIVIDSESELISKRKELIRLSKETNAGLNSTVSLYAELRRNTEDLGTSDSELMTVTKTLNNLFIAGARGAEQQASAITMLNRGLAEGVLRGEDYNSVVDVAPRIMEAIARTTGIATGEVRAFAATGGITSEVLIDALTSYSNEAQRLADATTKTFEQSTENARTNALAYVGASKSIQDATLALGGAIESASENIDAITKGLQAGLVVLGSYAAFAGGRALATMLGLNAANISRLKSEAQLTAATLANTQAEVANLTANRASYASSIQRIKSENIRNTIRTQLTATTVSLTAAESRLAIAENASSAAASRAAVSTIALTGATNALGVATRFLLGPWGLVLSAVGAAALVFTTAKGESDELTSSLSKQAEEVEKLEKKYIGMGKAQLGSAAVAARKELIDIEVQRREALDRFNKDVTSPNLGVSANAYRKYQEELELLDKQANSVKTTLKAMNNAFTSGLPGEWIDADESEQANAATNKQMSSLRKLQQEVGLSANNLFLFRQEQKSLANKDAPEVTAAIMKQANAYLSLKNTAEFKEVISSLDDLSKQQKLSADEYEMYTAKMKAIDAGFTGEQVTQIEQRIKAIQAERAEIENQSAYESWISGVESAVNRGKELQTEMDDVWLAMVGGDIDWDIGLKKIEQLQDEIDNIKAPDDMRFDIIADGATDSLKAMQSLSAQGSKEYRKLGVAIEAVNTIQAVSAVLNQAAGDPYTAFARMAAMAASVASLGYSVGSLSGGGFDDVAAQRQETQGTTVWGDKSESISNGIDMIASASEKLVGINTNMLKALTSVQDGIAKAAVLIGRDVETPTINQSDLVFDYSDVMGIFEPLGIEKLVMDPLGLFGKTFNKLFGGSSKVVDEGIQILGGTLGDMMDSITVQAFQQVQYKKWKFGSTKNKTATDDITDDVGDQFQLVLSSIADSVFEGATMLGLAGDEVTKAIQDFEIETIKISLKGLSAEEQQEEINAVFGSIFDDLAGDVVPFLDEFQKVGEGLGETLARVATQVNIMDLMVEQLGITMFDKFNNPQAYAEAAENISDLVGGIESLAEKTSGFIDNFATDATKLDIYQDSLTESLNAVGLELPGTSQGMWDLMSSLDASTEAGQEQIATLLNNQETAAAYYDMLDKITGRYRDAIDAMYDVSEATAQMTLDAALAAARMGDLSLAEDLDVDTLAPDMANYRSRLEYELARADTAAKLEELAKITEGTISIDEKQLTTLEEIRDSLKDGGNGAYNAEVSEIKKEVTTMNEVQKSQARNIADSNAILQQMLIDGIPVRIES